MRNMQWWFAVLAVSGMLAGTSVAETRQRIGGGVHYWTTVDDIEIGEIDDDGVAWLVSYQLRPSSLLTIELDVEMLLDNYAGAAVYVGGDDDDSFLETGEVWVYTACYTIRRTDPSPLWNIGTVTGRDMAGQPITATDAHSTTIEYAPELTIRKGGP